MEVEQPVGGAVGTTRPGSAACPARPVTEPAMPPARSRTKSTAPTGVPGVTVTAGERVVVLHATDQYESNSANALSSPWSRTSARDLELVLALHLLQLGEGVDALPVGVDGLDDPAVLRAGRRGLGAETEAPTTGAPRLSLTVPVTSTVLVGSAGSGVRLALTPRDGLVDADGDRRRGARSR